MATQLTPAQLQTLKAAILADPELNALPSDSNGAFAIANLLNLPSNPAQAGWNTQASSAAIIDAIDWRKYTPTDSADNTVTYSNRLLLIQTKQMNLQNIIVGREFIDASKANVRAGLRDAVIALPAGAGGALVSAGGASGATVLAACTRTMTRGEKIFAGADVPTGTVTAKLFTFQGELNLNDVLEARAA